MIFPRPGIDPDAGKDIMTSIGSMVDSSGDYASQAFDVATTAIKSLASEVNRAWPEFDFDSNLNELVGMQTLSAPSAQTIGVPTITPVSFTKSLPTLDTPIATPGEVPTFGITRPSVNIPDAPDDEFPIFTDSPPPQREIGYPDKPEFTLPDVPQLTDIAVPAPPEYEAASFEGVMPAADLTPPDTLFAFHEAEYSSEVKSQLISKLITQVRDGGTGLNADTEQAIWDRATARQRTENEKAYTEAMEFFSSRGFDLPEGVLNAQILEARARIDQQNADLNNDIMVKSADLAQKNTWQAIENAINYEKGLMDHANKVQQRAFEVARAVVEMASAVYAVKVEAFKVRLEGYKVQADVFASKIQAEIAKAEFFKAQVEGLRVSAQTQELLISAYNAKISGIKTMTEMYAVEMQAAKIEADIEKIRIDEYAVKADVYKTRTESLTAKYNAYQAQVAGEAEKVKIYEADARAYVAQVQGYQAKSEVDKSNSEIALANYQAQMEGFKAKLEEYNTKSNVAMKQAETEVNIETLKLQSYDVETRNFAAKVDAEVRAFVARVDHAKADAELKLKASDSALQGAINTKDVIVNAAIAEGKIGSQLAAAAMTSVGGSMSVGYRYSEGLSDNYSRSSTSSSTESESHNHHYNED